MKSLRDHVSGGDPRALHGVFEAVQTVLRTPARCAELVDLLFDADEIVRFRASDAIEKLAAARPDLITPFAERLLTEAGRIHQPSVQWHLAQILTEIRLSASQARRAAALLEQNLHSTTDWIVQNLTLEALAYFALRGDMAVDRFVNIAKAHLDNPHKSVARRATKLVAQFSAA